jgi:hypothetical protein
LVGPVGPLSIAEKTTLFGCAGRPDHVADRLTGVDRRQFLDLGSATAMMVVRFFAKFSFARAIDAIAELSACSLPTSLALAMLGPIDEHEEDASPGTPTHFLTCHSLPLSVTLSVSAGVRPA